MEINKMLFLTSRKGSLDRRTNYDSCPSIFCPKNNLHESLSTLIEELDCLDIFSKVTNEKDLCCVESLRDILSELINASWRLVHKHRSLMRNQDEEKDTYARVAHDNSNMRNQLRRLKEDIETKAHVLLQVQERERRLSAKCDNMSRELKGQSNEVVKLKKQSLSKDSQRVHEIRRAVRNEQKLREQLHKKFVGSCTHKDKSVQTCSYTNQQHDNEIRSYKQAIRRLEENNRLMLDEINELKEALALSAVGTDLHIEASEIWTDVET